MSGGTVYYRLNRHASSLMIGSVFLFLSGVMYMFMCGLDERCSGLDHSKSHNDDRPAWKSVLGRSDRVHAFFVVLVLTSHSNKDRRNAIRRTWMSLQMKDTKLMFATGTKNLSPEDVAHLKKEDSIHNDILLLHKAHDSYEKLTEKVREGFIWLDANVEYKYVLKCDDDSFARINVIYEELKRRRTERLYWGFFNGNAHVKRSGPWAEPNWIMCDHYLPYARGGGYLLSADLVHYIANAGPYLKTFNSEDVSVGAWLGPLDINRVHDPRFDTEYKSRGCHNSYVITHKITIETMDALFKNLKENGNLCAKEVRIHNSYIYNWNVQPSKCCIRNSSLIP